MKTLFLSLAFLLSSSSLLAVTYEGQLEVAAEEGFDLVHSTAFGNKKSRSFSPGSHEGAQVKLLSSGKLRIRATEESAKMLFPPEFALPTNGGFSLPSSTSGQKYDIKGSTSTVEDVSESQSDYETCTYLATDKFCLRNCLASQGYGRYNRGRWDYRWGQGPRRSHWFTLSDHHEKGKRDHQHCEDQEQGQEGNGDEAKLKDHHCHKGKGQHHGHHHKYRRHHRHHGHHHGPEHRYAYHRCLSQCQMPVWGERSVTYRTRETARELSLEFLTPEGEVAATYSGTHRGTKKLYEHTGVCH